MKCPTCGLPIMEEKARKSEYAYVAQDPIDRSVHGDCRNSDYPKCTEPTKNRHLGMALGLIPGVFVDRMNGNSGWEEDGEAK